MLPIKSMIKLDKLAILCHQTAIRRKKIGEHSSARGIMLAISAEWRELMEASMTKESGHIPEWTEMEEEAADVIIGCMTLLQHMKCESIEQLLRDKIEFNRKRED